MRSRWLIWVWEGITLAVIVIIFYWQLVTLPNLRVQVISGLENDLNKLTRDAAKELADAYSQAVVSGNLAFLKDADRENFSSANHTEIKKVLRKVAQSQKLSDAWVTVYVNPTNGALTAWEYKPPSRYRPNVDVLGSMQTGTELTRITEVELSKVLGKYRTIAKFTREYWAISPDSTVVLVHQPEFNRIVLTGSPVYTGDGVLKGFIFNRLNIKDFEKRFIPDFFQNQFWHKGDTRGNLERKHLQFGVFSTKANRLLYNSVAFGKKEFEHQEALTGVNAWLSDYLIGVGFKNSSTETVGTAIYNRTRFLIIGMFIGLALLVIIIFAAMRRIAVVSSLKSEFVSNVTHEIKTPLASIQAAADTLRLRKGLTEQQQESLYLILHKETDRLQDMIHSLLDFSSIEAGRKNYRFEEVETAAWWSRIETFVRERAGAHMGVFSGEVPPGWVNVDLKSLDQVMGILIDNGLKYSPDKKQVDVEVREDGGNLRIAVTDHGIGIAKENLQLVFDKFVRIGNLDQHNVKGYGIGLSIARGILKAHNGLIGVKSTLGQGSTFYFLLPLLKQPTKK